MKTSEAVLIGAFCVVFAAVICVATMMPTPERVKNEWRTRHYCDLVSLYEQTKHLPDGQVKGHKAYLGDEQCK